MAQYVHEQDDTGSTLAVANKEAEFFPVGICRYGGSLAVHLTTKAKKTIPMEIRYTYVM